MREILFRAKGKGSGNWLYGYYARLRDVTGMNDVLYTPARDPDDSNHTYCITPETVGRYTGLKDKNGTRIFEGDILSAHLDDEFLDEEIRGCVCWHAYGWHIKIGPHLETIEDDWVGYFFEVIGNIYDNPEFLEATKEEKKDD